MPLQPRVMLTSKRQHDKSYIRVPTRMIADVLVSVEVEDLGDWPVDHLRNLNLH